MSNPSSGLRFDVYERVHLPDDVAAIDELEEIELVPRIQIVQQGEQVLLKGHLLLSGVYRAPDGLEGDQALEHMIPVEITLPMNRINRLDDIAVEIDNFDVDLLSARTLNVTGVLSLLGIEIEQKQEQEEWREEPFTVVHKREDEEQLPSWGAPVSQPSPPRVQEPPAGFDGWGAPVSQPSPPGVQEPPAGFDGWAAPASQPSPPRVQEPPAGFDGWAAPVTQGFREPANREIAEREAANREAALREQLQRETEEAGREQRRLEAEQRDALAFQKLRQADAEREAAALRAAQLEEEERERALEEEREDARREAAEWEAYRLEALRQQQLEEEEEILNLSELEAEEPEGSNRESQRTDQQFSTFHPAAEEQPPDPSVFAADSPLGAQPIQIDPVAAEPEPAPKEMRVALGIKPSDEASGQPAGNVGFRSLLQSSLREQEARAVAKQDAQKAAEAASQPNGDEIEWKNLFFGRSADDQSFRRLRMCIVQREETLETIASRYQMQPREIALYNRLSDHSINEGQVLYIP